MFFKEIEEEIRSVENQEIISEYRSLQNSLELLDRNFHAIERTLDAIKKDPKKFKLIPRYNKWLLEGLVKEIGFLLHNYVSSSLSLIDHSRRVYEKMFKRKNELETYEKLKKRYLISSYLEFIKDLRIMLQHHSLASIGFQFFGGTGESNFFLQKIDLLRFKKWSNKSKKLIQTFDDSIDIMSVIGEYHKEISNFHRKVYSQYKIVYKPELEELEQLYSQYNDKVNELGLRELKNHVTNFDDQGFHGIKYSFATWLSNAEQAELNILAKNNKHYCKLAYSIVKKKVSIPNDIVSDIEKLLEDG